MNLFKVAALAALVVSAGAMATYPQQAQHSTLKIYQQGNGNNATALQSNALYSKTEIKQFGTVNGAKVGQGSDHSDIKLLQDGYGNNATISQWNGKNAQTDVLTCFKLSGLRNPVRQRQPRFSFPVLAGPVYSQAT